MRSTAWMLPVRVQAIPQPTVDGSSQGAEHLGDCMVCPQCEKKRSADGTHFGGQRVFVFALPSQHRGGSAFTALEVLEFMADGNLSEIEYWDSNEEGDEEVKAVHTRGIRSTPPPDGPQTPTPLCGGSHEPMISPALRSTTTVNPLTPSPPSQSSVSKRSLSVHKTPTAAAGTHSASFATALRKLAKQAEEPRVYLGCSDSSYSDDISPAPSAAVKPRTPSCSPRRASAGTQRSVKLTPVVTIAPNEDGGDLWRNEGSQAPPSEPADGGALELQVQPEPSSGLLFSPVDKTVRQSTQML
ncbi:UNVERIFIED_CONTAM: hypothetical protein FKN15_045535 [Acipenser sinensis]